MTVWQKFLIGVMMIYGTVDSFECNVPFAGEASFGYDYFRGMPDGDWEGNTGAFLSANLEMPTPYCQGITAFQMGASYGLYDWHGRLSAPSDKQERLQQQLFVTTGVSRRTPCESGWNFGLVYDWMWNRGFGVFGLSPIIDQLRFQTGYLSCCRNEFGLWGTLDLHWSRNSSQQIPVTYRALSQCNLFWKHIFPSCGETVVWAGVPTKRSLMFSGGRAGKFTLGGSCKAPLTDCITLEGRGSYMWPHSAPGAYKQRYYGANIAVELKWQFGSGCCRETPYMPLANNSNFLVDTNTTY